MMLTTMHTPLQLQMWKERPHSHSQQSAFTEYSKEEWYQKYLLGESLPANVMMTFGRDFGSAAEWGTPMAPVTMYKSMEHRLDGVLDGIPLIGYMDTWNAEDKIMRDYKTGPKKWDQKRADETKQLTFYALQLHLTEGIRPEDITYFIDWVPCEFKEDGSYGFKIDEQGHASVHSFETKRTTLDILKFANEIKETRKAMEEFIHSKELALAAT